MKLFFSTLPRNVIECFKARMLVFHVGAILLTIGIVLSGLDWQYFQWTRSPALLSRLWPAVPIGGLLPIVLPLTLLVLGGVMRSAPTRLIGWAIAQAEVIGGIIAAGYKAITGRAHPAHGVGMDLTHVFKFGLLRGGVFWGWPSSHTTIAFAMAVTVFRLFPKQRWIGWLAIAYAFYIGVGVSATIHWFSDFVAGALIGTAVGMVVGGVFSAAK
ncbi:MAG TPA: phosphatase PAP2 family protein [Verrucomicrobiae bacterium]|nr:phosphatase PAP2 family protein [Verrucomicrobiae bacterium]